MAKHHQPSKKPFPLVLVAVIAVFALLTAGLYMHRSSTKASLTHEQAESTEKSEMHEEYEEPKHEKEIKVIELTADGFNPQKVTVTEHETIVAFVNKDSLEHTIIADTNDKNGTPMFNTGALKPGQQLSVIEYSETGTYTYHSQNNPDAKGTIIVEEDEH